MSPRAKRALENSFGALAPSQSEIANHSREAWAVHAQNFGCLALISFVALERLRDHRLFELQYEFSQRLAPDFGSR